MPEDDELDAEEEALFDLDSEVLDEDEYSQEALEEEEMAEEEPEPTPKPKKPKKKLGTKIGVGMIVAGLVLLAFIPIWTYVILPPQKILPDTKDTYKDEFYYEGEIELLDQSTYSLVKYENAKGTKFQQLNSSTDKYLNLYGNVTVYDKDGNFIMVLTHSTPTVNRETYEELYEGKDRPRWFPIGTEKKSYKFGNPFVSSYINTYDYETNFNPFSVLD